MLKNSENTSKLHIKKLKNKQKLQILNTLN